jgi:predicted ATPase/class 3 adenylate cyclase/Tfp pilus assembly protein PilF
VHDPLAVKTLLFTDIEGSTRLWAQEPERMPLALAHHDALLRAAIESNRGSIVKMTGDGIYASFDDPLDGLYATLAVQHALADPAATVGVPLYVRCALHVGAVEHRDGDYFGTAVNRAARIMGAAHGGQVLISQAAAELVSDRLPAGVALRDLGSIRLRDLAHPARVFQVLRQDLRQDFPALRSLEATPNNLPLQVTSFVGRERELGELRGLLEDARLVTIVGPGGIGKTRMSLQIAADVLHTCPDGAWFIEFAAIVDSALVPKAVAQVLGIREDADTPIVQALCAHLATRRALLVLDNCEHLVAACANLADALLRAAPEVRILASSREPLDVAGEQTYALPPLALPEPGSRADAAACSDAGQLFVERARLRQSGFSLTEKNVDAVAKICARLDGIPLALELAAARVGVLSVGAIAERLNDRFRLLTGGSRTAMPRQQTLRALIDWSYDLLGAAEKTLFTRLSVFTGGWTLAAAEDVSTGNDLASDAVLDLMIGLAHKSLIVPESDGARYRMLESIRDYARDRLQERGETVAVRVRHRDYFLKLAEDAEPHLEGGHDQPEWLRQLELEHDNLRAALGWSLEEGVGTESDLRLCGALFRFWAHRGHAIEGHRWCVAALARNEGQAATTARAKALHASGTLAWRLGDITVARSLLEQALALSRDLGDTVREGRILNNLGGVAIHQSDHVAAQGYLEQGVAIHRAMGDRAMEARVLNNLVALNINDGRFAEAQEPLERALALGRELDNPMEEANSMSHMGFLASQRGDLTQAQDLHERALGTARRFGVREFEIEELRHLGSIALARNDLAAARAQYRSGLSISKEIGSLHEIVLCLEAMTALMVECSEFADAARLCGVTDALRDATATPRAFYERELYETTVANCRSALGEIAASDAIAAGRNLPADAQIANALTWISEPET